VDCGCVCIVDDFVVLDLWKILLCMIDDLWMICVDLAGEIDTSRKK
jgi:hypothetical protein